MLTILYTVSALTGSWKPSFLLVFLLLVLDWILFLSAASAIIAKKKPPTRTKTLGELGLADPTDTEVYWTYRDEKDGKQNP